MSILSYSRLAALLKAKNLKPYSDDNLPHSAIEKMHKSSESKPYNVNRDANGSRPWHSHNAKLNHQR